VTNLKQHQNGVQENTQQLKKDREDYKDNFWERTLVGVLVQKLHLLLTLNWAEALV
jgi:uncharacterized membrane protein YesL